MSDCAVLGVRSGVHSSAFEREPINLGGPHRVLATHRSVTDPEARLARKGRTGASLCHLGNVLMENRHGLVVATDVRSPSYEAERDAALALIRTRVPRAHRRTLGADRGYDYAALRHRAPLGWRHRGREAVHWMFTFTNAVYNLVRIRTLIHAGVCA